MTVEFEVVNYTPPLKVKNSKYAKLHVEMMQTLLKVPPGKSIRRGYATAEEVKAYANSVRVYLKKQKLNGSYFVSLPDMVENDGKFYVYIGRREGE